MTLALWRTDHFFDSKTCEHFTYLKRLSPLISWSDWLLCFGELRRHRRPMEVGSAECLLCRPRAMDCATPPKDAPLIIRIYIPLIVMLGWEAQRWGRTIARVKVTVRPPPHSWFVYFLLYPKIKYWKETVQSSEFTYSEFNRIAIFCHSWQSIIV